VEYADAIRSCRSAFVEPVWMTSWILAKSTPEADSGTEAFPSRRVVKESGVWRRP